MAKRRLTYQQVTQQKKTQAARIKRSENLEKNTVTELSPEQPGLLIAHHGVHLIIESQTGTLHHCKIRQSLGSLVTGDKIIWQQAPDGSGIVVAVLERMSILARPDPHSNYPDKMKPIAANIDLLVIVVAPKPELSATTIDAYLVIAQQLAIKPLIVVNKSDLLRTIHNNDLLERLAIYQSLGYDWIETSTLHAETQDAPTLKKLTDYLKDKTSVFVGQSGVGKSSLIRYLIPDAQVRIGELCQITDLGKHTTTGSRLYHLPKGGNLIDSPGIRRFGLWHLSEKNLAKGFIEFAPYLGHCQFRNCRHQNEVGCAIMEARDKGLIHPLRVQNFYELLNKHGSDL